MTQKSLQPEVLPPATSGTRPLPVILQGHLTGPEEQRVDHFYASVPDIWETWLKRTPNPHTRRAYTTSVETFARFLGWQVPDELLRFLTVGVDQVQAYRDWLVHEREHAHKTVALRISALSNWFGYLDTVARELRLNIQVPNPADKSFVRRSSDEPRTPTPALTPVQVRSLFELAEGDSLVSLRDRALLGVFFYAAPRIAAVQALDVVDFRATDEGASLRLYEKGQRTRVIGLHRTAARYLRAYIRGADLTDGALFRRAAAPKPSRLLGRLSLNGIRRILRGYYDRIGLPPAGQRYAAHTARATAATLLLRTGADLVAVQSLLGHKSINTTRRYVRTIQTLDNSASHDIKY